MTRAVNDVETALELKGVREEEIKAKVDIIAETKSFTSLNAKLNRVIQAQKMSEENHSLAETPAHSSTVRDDASFQKAAAIKLAKPDIIKPQGFCII